MKKTETDILPVLKAMRVGQTKQWELSRAHTVRSIIYTCSVAENRVFRTKSDRKKSLLLVTRVS